MMFGDLKTYAEYKDSCVEWLGDVPAHWQVHRLRNLVEMRVSNVDKHVRDGEQAVSLCNYVDVYKHERIGPEISFMSATATAYEIERFKLATGDVLITKDSEDWTDIGVPAVVEEAPEDVLCGYHLALLRPRADRMRGQFLLRALQSKVTAPQFHVRANGVTRYGLSHDAIKSVWLTVPPITEQAVISRFLDQATLLIDNYIRAKEKLTTLLEDQKRVIINDAVRGRFDVSTGKPYATYKSSGSDWLGDVPAHWKIRKLGRMGRFFKGGGGTKADEKEAGVPCIRYGDLYTQHQFFITSSRSYVSPKLAATTYAPIRYGDVLFAGSGETIDEIGKSAVNLVEGPVCCGGDVIVFRPSIGVDARLLGYATDCPAAAQQKACMGRGFTVMHIYASELKYMTVALPNPDEQARIAHFLDEATTSIDAAIARSRCQVDLLREYRTRLVADVVTGKVDVREANTALPDESAFTFQDGSEEIQSHQGGKV